MALHQWGFADETHDGADQRGLAHAVAAHQAERLAGLQHQGHAAQDVALASVGVGMPEASMAAAVMEPFLTPAGPVETASRRGST